MEVDVILPATGVEKGKQARTLEGEEERRRRAHGRLAMAARRLRRYLPKAGSWEEDLLTEWGIVEKATAVFVFSKFARSVLGDKGDMLQVCGRRVWLVQMVIDHNREHPDEWKKLFVFDEEDERWLELMSTAGDEEYETVMDLMFAPVKRDYVTLDWRSAVLGSRKITDVTRITMRDLFGLTASELFKRRTHLHPPYDHWVAGMLYDNSNMMRGPK